jgi:hypothetical protein
MKMVTETWKKVLAGIGLGAAAAIAIKLAYETFKTEPVHAVFSRRYEATIKSRFASDGGRFLEFGEEFKQPDSRWGVAVKIPPEYELHVRAHEYPGEEFYLSAHFEYNRDTPKHLIKSGDYGKGKEMLQKYLDETGLSAYQLQAREG